MKKVCLVLAAILCMVLPVSAFAEVSAYSFAISDLTMSVGGFPILSLPGVELETDIATLEDGSFGMRSAIQSASGTAFKLLGNSTLSGAKMYVDGMSDAYGIDFGNILGESTKSIDLNDIASSKEFAFLMNLGTQLNLNFENYIVSTTTEEYDGIPFERKDFVIEAAETDRIISDFMNALDDSGTIAVGFRASLGLDANYSFADEYAKSNTKIMIEGAYWEGDTGITLDMYFNVSNDGGVNFDSTAEFYFDLVDDGTNDPVVTIIVDFDAAELQATITIGDTAVKAEFIALDMSDASNPVLQGKINVYAGEVSANNNALYVLCQDGKGNDVFALSFNMNEADGKLDAYAYYYENALATGISLTADGLNENSSQMNATLQVVEENQNIATLAASYVEEDECSGKFKVRVLNDSGMEQFGISFHVKCAEKNMRDADFAIPVSNTVNLAELTDRQSEVAVNELEKIATDVSETLSKDLPALGLINGLFGN